MSKPFHPSLNWDVDSEDAAAIQQLLEEDGYPTLFASTSDTGVSVRTGNENRSVLSTSLPSLAGLSSADAEAVRRVMEEDGHEAPWNLQDGSTDPSTSSGSSNYSNRTTSHPLDFIGVSKEDEEAIRRALQDDDQEDENLARVFAGMPDRPVSDFPFGSPFVSSLPMSNPTTEVSRKRKPGDSSETTMSPVDPKWETLDPIPDIRALFVEFDRAYFWGSLSSVEVKWSPQMFSCAGICTYHGSRSGYCTIGLSKPLLQLRPRKDLVETLLHEMIHAYLFVASNERDRESHGANFHAHMYRINREIGSNISVYHSFHDEVNHYKTHVWRCNGPCKDERPYFGYVKRAMNRAPSKNDRWWESHVEKCGGQFIKIREPEGFKSRKRKTDGTEATVSGKISQPMPSDKGQPTLEKWGFSPTADRGSKTTGLPALQPTVPHLTSQVSRPLLFDLSLPGATGSRQPGKLPIWPFSNVQNVPVSAAGKPNPKPKPAPRKGVSAPSAVGKANPDVIVLD